MRDAGGKSLKAQYYVFACGPWLGQLFPDLLLPKLQVQRRDVLFVGTPAGNDQFSHPNLPSWSIYGSGYYGFSDIEGRGLKVAPYPDYNSFDPDMDERIVKNTWIVGAGSGGGFKHGPSIGEYAAKRILGEEVDLAYTQLFKLKEKDF